jgi:hypothetical protein
LVSSNYCDDDLAYLVGLYVAEGDIPKRSNGKPICVRFSFGEHERHSLAEAVKVIAERMGKRVVIAPVSKSVCTVRIYDADLAYFMEKHAGMYSEHKRLSEDICIHSSKSFKENLLRGMVDGDGCIQKGNKTNKSLRSIEFNTASSVLADQIFMMLVAVGYAPSLYHSMPSQKEKKIDGRLLANLKPMHHVRILDDAGYSRWLGLNSAVTSKSESFIYGGNLFCRVSRVDKRRPKDGERFFDLSVRGDESYVASFLSVHNCTRKRVTGQQEHCSSAKQLADWVNYLRSHPEVKDVIVSGGDPFTMETDKLDELLTAIRSVETVETIRIGTRTPVVMPMRIDDELVTMLRKHHPVWVNTHFNHPQEITPEAVAACAKLADAGIPLGNQSVLLKGINDNPDIMADLCRKLVKMRVRPYYLFACDLVRGVEHFRTPVEVGLHIMESLRGRISGMAIPLFVVDLPGGGGKVPMLPSYVEAEASDSDGITFRNYANERFHYPNPAIVV